MLNVKDLFTLMLYRIFECASSLFQDLDYKVAIAHNLSLKGVILSSANSCFNFNNKCDIIITSLNNRFTLNFSTFIAIAQEVSSK